MGWIFKKVDEDPCGYSGVRYMDGYEGQEEYKQEDKFLPIRKYHSLKRNLGRVREKLSKYPDEVPELDKKTKEHKEYFVKTITPIIQAIEEIEDE